MAKSSRPINEIQQSLQTLRDSIPAAETLTEVVDAIIKSKNPDKTLQTIIVNLLTQIKTTAQGLLKPCITLVEVQGIKSNIETTKKKVTDIYNILEAKPNTETMLAELKKFKQELEHVKPSSGDTKTKEQVKALLQLVKSTEAKVDITSTYLAEFNKRKKPEVIAAITKALADKEKSMTVIARFEQSVQKVEEKFSTSTFAPSSSALHAAPAASRPQPAQPQKAQQKAITTGPAGGRRDS